MVIGMLGSCSKASLWGCTVCYNHKKKNCREDIEEKTKSTPLKDFSESGLFTKEETEFFAGLGLLKPEKKSVDYCSIAGQKIESLTACPL